MRVDADDRYVRFTLTKLVPGTNGDPSVLVSYTRDTTNDGSTPPDVVSGTIDLIAGGRFELVEGAGHLPCVEDPDKVAALITGFLEENGIV